MLNMAKLFQIKIACFFLFIVWLSNYYFFSIENFLGRCDGSEDCQNGEDETDCEHDYMHDVFIPENNTLISYVNHSTSADLVSISKNLTINNKQNNSNHDGLKQVAAAVSNPISSYLLSQQQHIRKSSQTNTASSLIDQYNVDDQQIK